jgi:hypothetical protein
MGQIDRIKEDLAEIASKHAAPDVVQREVQQRIARFVKDASEFYADEPDGKRLLRKDLSTLGDALHLETERGHPPALARAMDYAFEAVTKALHPGRKPG